MIQMFGYSNLKDIARQIGQIIPEGMDNNLGPSIASIVNSMKLSEAWDALEAMKKLISDDRSGNRVRSLLEQHPQLISAMYEIQKRLGIVLPPHIQQQQAKIASLAATMHNAPPPMGNMMMMMGGGGGGSGPPFGKKLDACCLRTLIFILFLCVFYSRSPPLTDNNNNPGMGFVGMEMDMDPNNMYGGNPPSMMNMMNMDMPPPQFGSNNFMDGPNHMMGMNMNMMGGGSGEMGMYGAGNDFSMGGGGGGMNMNMNMPPMYNDDNYNMHMGMGPNVGTFPGPGQGQGQGGGRDRDRDRDRPSRFSSRNYDHNDGYN